MSNPFNMLPVPPGFTELGDRLAEEAAKATGSPAVLVIIQPLGKLGVFIAADNAPPEVQEVLSEPPKLFAYLSYMMTLADAVEAAQAAGVPKL